VNPHATQHAIATLQAVALKDDLKIPAELIQRYGADAPQILSIASESHALPGSPEGFPRLDAQLRFSIRTELAMHLVDFYFRRLPIYASRADHGLPWADELSRVWAEERGLSEAERQAELEGLRTEVARRSAWKAQT
jgi:glycerol-3-phosphate dehydrogenase